MSRSSRIAGEIIGEIGSDLLWTRKQLAEAEATIVKLRIDLAEYARYEGTGVREVIAQAEREGITWDKAEEIVASIIAKRVRDALEFGPQALRLAQAKAEIGRLRELLEGEISNEQPHD